MTQSIVQPELIKVDFRTLAWLGVVAADYRTCYGFGPNGVKTWDEMMKRKTFILGSTGKGAGNYINGAVLRIVFNAPVRQILGYPGSAEQRIAIERGELDGDCGAYASITPNWIAEKKVHPFVRFSANRGDDIPESAVYIGNFAKTDEQRALLNVLSGGDEIGRPFIMSKQVPADRLAILRQAFNRNHEGPGLHRRHAEARPSGAALAGREGGSDRRHDVRRLARGAEAGARDLRIGPAPQAIMLL